MNDSLSPKQRLALFWLVFVGQVADKRTGKLRPALQSDIKPELNAADRKTLVDQELISLEPRPKGRGMQVVLTDKAWEWASHNLEAELSSKSAAAASETLTSVFVRLSNFFRARSLNLSDLFHEPERVVPTSVTPQPTVEEQIRQAYLQLSGRRLGQMVRLADLKQALSQIPTRDIDQALLAMQQKGDVSLQTIESMRQTTEEDHRVIAVFAM